jgi:hypothetical protein
VWIFRDCCKKFVYLLCLLLCWTRCSSALCVDCCLGDIPNNEIVTVSFSLWPLLFSMLEVWHGAAASRLMP